jgi:hypothetical protein
MDVRPSIGGRSLRIRFASLVPRRSRRKGDSGVRVDLSTLDLSAGSMAILVFSLAIVMVVVALILLVVVTRRRQFVFESSTALRELTAVNLRCRDLVVRRKPIKVPFEVDVNSKAKFDRFDLRGHMASSVLEHENWFDAEIGIRLESIRVFAAYHHDFEAIAARWLGKSSHPKLSDKRFAAIEKRIFSARKLRSPTPSAAITSTVRYRSPQGRNSYANSLTWNFDELRQGLVTAKALREHQSTQEFLRKRERSLLTPKLRVDILRRDANRCQMCGASASGGATLHIDHITPVSRGGRTIPQNLQVLCESCNLGKSNRFVG